MISNKQLEIRNKMKLPNLNQNIYKKGHVMLGSEILKAFLL